MYGCNDAILGLRWLVAHRPEGATAHRTCPAPTPRMFQLVSAARKWTLVFVSCYCSLLTCFMCQFVTCCFLHCCFPHLALGSRCCDPALLLSQSVGWLAVLIMTSAFSLLIPVQERTPHNDNDFVFANDACVLNVCRLSACEAWRWREHVGAGVV